MPLSEEAMRGMMKVLSGKRITNEDVKSNKIERLKSTLKNLQDALAEAMWQRESGGYADIDERIANIQAQIASVSKALWEEEYGMIDSFTQGGVNYGGYASEQGQPRGKKLSGGTIPKG